MSDRIDELVAAIDANTLLQWDGKDVALEAAHELATIAREAEARALKAEAMCEWLTMTLTDATIGDCPASLTDRQLAECAECTTSRMANRCWLKAASEEADHE